MTGTSGEARVNNRIVKLKASTMGTEKNVHLPEGLLARIAAAARAENRAPDDLVEDAVERYLGRQKLERLYAYGEERARALGLKERDVPRLIAESRREAKERER